MFGRSFDFLVSFMSYAVTKFDPLRIATEGTGSEDIVNKDIVELLELDNLFYVLKENAILLTSIVLVVLLISMQFITKSEKLAEKKADVLHKFKIIFLVFSLIWLLEVFIALLVEVF